MRDSPKHANEDSGRRMRLTLLCIAVLVSLCACAKPEAIGSTQAHSVVAGAAGAKIYMERCALCHGSKGLGEGSMPLLVRDYPSTNLRKLLEGHTPDAITVAIAEGGAQDSGNMLSPPWKHEISESDLKLVSNFVNLLRVDYAAAVEAIQRAAPATDLTASVLTDEARMAIIRRGGAALGRSPQMPPWGQELTSSELESLVGYLRSIAQRDIQVALD